MNGREWTTEDLTEIAKLEEECFSDPWSQRMLADSFLSDGFFGSLLEEGNTITAYGGMRTVGEEAEIELIATAEMYRRWFKGLYARSRYYPNGEDAIVMKKELS